MSKLALDRLKAQLERRFSAVQAASSDLDGLVAATTRYIRFAESRFPKSIIARLDYILEHDAELKRRIDDKTRDGLPACLEWPEEEDRCAAVYLWVARYVEGDPGQAMRSRGITRFFGESGESLLRAQRFIATLLHPLHDYLIECIEGGELYIEFLWKYKRLVELCEGEELYSELKPKFLETQCEKHLLRFLTQNLDVMPISQPQLKRTRVDLALPHEESANPIPFEVKVYDGKKRALKNVSSGINQAATYANLFDTDCGYTVVFNVCDRPLQFGDDTNKVPEIQLQNRRVYCIPIQVCPLPPPSKSQPAPIILPWDKLVPPAIP